MVWLKGISWRAKSAQKPYALSWHPFYSVQTIWAPGSAKLLWWMCSWTILQWKSASIWNKQRKDSSSALYIITLLSKWEIAISAPFHVQKAVWWNEWLGGRGVWNWSHSRLPELICNSNLPFVHVFRISSKLGLATTEHRVPFFKRPQIMCFQHLSQSPAVS